MKQQRLSFNEMGLLFTPLTVNSMRGLKGGFTSSGIYEIGVGNDGINDFWMIKNDKGEWVQAEFLIPEVSIQGTTPVRINYDYGFGGWTPNGFFNGDLTSVIYGSNFGGGGGGGGNNNNIGTLISSGPAGTSLFDAVSLMFASMGAAATQAQISASIANLESVAQNGFNTTSRIFGSLNILSNAYEFYNDPNWEDAGQITMGIVLTFGTLNPASAIIGGIILAGWELYEYKRDN